MTNETKISAELYSYRVFWSQEDKEFVGVCSEFPSLSHLAETQEGAFTGIRDLVASVLLDLQKEGAPIPERLDDPIEQAARELARLVKNVALTHCKCDVCLMRELAAKVMGDEK